MGTWKLVDNAILQIMRGNLSLSNATAGRYRIVFTYGGVYTNCQANVSVADFINVGTGESNNYSGTGVTNARPSLASVTLSVTDPTKPLWSSANVNVVVSGGTMDTNYAAIYDLASTDDVDGNTNIICIGDLGTQAVSDSTNLVLDLSAGILQGDDPNYP